MPGQWIFDGDEWREAGNIIAGGAKKLVSWLMLLLNLGLKHWQVPALLVLMVMMAGSLSLIIDFGIEAMKWYDCGFWAVMYERC